jgi:hypothetical protein
MVEAARAVVAATMHCRQITGSHLRSVADSHFHFICVSQPQQDVFGSTLKGANPMTKYVHGVAAFNGHALPGLHAVSIAQASAGI